MIFRAIFWVGVVALLMPREPASGLGHPLGHPTELSSPKSATGLAGAVPAGSLCNEHAQACATGLSLVDSFQDKAIRGLAAVKADIDANRRPFPAYPL